MTSVICLWWAVFDLFELLSMLENSQNPMNMDVTSY